MTLTIIEQWYGFCEQKIQHLSPVTDFYKKLSLDCSAQQIAVDMFMLNAQYADIATVGQLYPSCLCCEIVLRLFFVLVMSATNSVIAFKCFLNLIFQSSPIKTKKIYVCKKVNQRADQFNLLHVTNN